MNVKEEAKLILESGFFDKIFLTPIKSARSMQEDELAGLFAKASAGMIEKGFKDGVSALKAALSEKKENDRIYIGGSLYLAGEILEEEDLMR